MYHKTLKKGGIFCWAVAPYMVLQMGKMMIKLNLKLSLTFYDQRSMVEF